MKKLNTSGIVHYLMPVAAFVVVGVVGSIYLYASHAATPCTGQTIGVGNSGQCVKDLQGVLNGIHAGYGVPISNYPLTVDGQFGSLTQGAVKSWQADKVQVGTSVYKTISVDGVAGPQTWAKICALVKSDNYNSNDPGIKPYAVNAGC